MEQNKQSTKHTMYVGTYMDQDSPGIFTYQFDERDGSLERSGAYTGVDMPSFLAIHPSGKYVYAVSEVEKTDGVNGGKALSFRIEPGTGHIRLLNEQPTMGEMPCHLSVHPDGTMLLVANYQGGSVSVFPLDSDGRIQKMSDYIQHQGCSINAQRQESPHPHAISFSPDGRLAYIPDLGTDHLMIYHIKEQSNAIGRYGAIKMEPGSGPRHIAFHPNQRFVYVINELNSTITGFTGDINKGQLQQIQQTSTLPEHFSGISHCADIHVHPSGKFLYGSNRGHDSLAVYHIDPTTGKLTSQGHVPTKGKIPRNFAISPGGQYLLAENQDSDTIVVFKIDQHDGHLSAPVFTEPVPQPVCILFNA